MNEKSKWHIVPVEPTKEMVEAASNVFERRMGLLGSPSAETIGAAMSAAVAVASSATPNYKRMFEAAVLQLADISVALGIPDEEAEWANGNDLILAAIAELKAERNMLKQDNDDVHETLCDYMAMSNERDQLRERIAHLEAARAVPEGWKLVPVEPSPQIIAAAAIAVWPAASSADVEMARKAAPIVLMSLDAVPGATVEMVAAALATMAPAYRAMINAAGELQ